MCGLLSHMVRLHAGRAVRLGVVQPHSLRAGVGATGGKPPQEIANATTEASVPHHRENTMPIKSDVLLCSVDLLDTVFKGKLLSPALKESW